MNFGKDEFSEEWIDWFFGRMNWLNDWLNYVCIVVLFDVLLLNNVSMIVLMWLKIYKC